MDQIQKRQIDARIWALKLDITILKNAATRDEKSGLKKSAHKSREAAQTLEFEVRRLQKEYGICPCCGEECGYWNLPLVCGK